MLFNIREINDMDQFLSLSFFFSIVFANCRLYCFEKVMAINAMKARSVITHIMKPDTFTSKFTG